MKYIVGASIGGLFGLCVPMMMNIQEPNDKVPRIEDSQPVEDTPDMSPIDPSQGFHHLPDNVCRYIKLESEGPKEQAKECLNIPVMAVPAI